jgi:UDP-glucose 4-epimerase
VRALVTGGAGFIGSNLVDALIERGDSVEVVDNLSSGKRENVSERAQLHELDVREPLNGVFADLKPDVCFHLAAQADVRVSIERPDYDAEVNVIGTLRVLEAAHAAGSRVVFASTGGAIYGECDAPADESSERRPLAPYGAAKLAGEEYLLTYRRLYGMSNVVLRFANVFGPRQDPHGEAGVVAIFLGRLRDAEICNIFGDGEQERDYVYVGDVVQAALVAAEVEGGVFNVGTGRATSVLELYELCRKVAGSGLTPRLSPARAGELQRSVLDVGKVERELGWRPQTSLEEGLRRTWDWIAHADIR